MHCVAMQQVPATQLYFYKPRPLSTFSVQPTNIYSTSPEHIYTIRANKKFTELCPHRECAVYYFVYK